MRQQQVQARELRERGWTWQDIAGQCGYASPGSAYNAACKAGFTPRGGTVGTGPAFWWTTVVPVRVYQVKRRSEAVSQAFRGDQTASAGSWEAGAGAGGGAGEDVGEDIDDGGGDVTCSASARSSAAVRCRVRAVTG
jgi:hypothetical protein